MMTTTLPSPLPPRRPNHLRRPLWSVLSWLPWAACLFLASSGPHSLLLPSWRPRGLRSPSADVDDASRFASSSRANPLRRKGRRRPLPRRRRTIVRAAAVAGEEAVGHATTTADEGRERELSRAGEGTSREETREEEGESGKAGEGAGKITTGK